MERNMTRRQELLNAPKFTGNENLDDCRELWIIPTRRKHESGYNCMIIIVGYMDNGEEKYVRCEGYIDHLWGNDLNPKSYSTFSIDCDDGVLHLYHYGHSFKVSWWGTSTFEINPNREVKGNG